MFPTFQMVLNEMNIEHILYIRDGSDWSYKSSVNAKVPADSVIAYMKHCLSTTINSIERRSHARLG